MLMNYIKTVSLFIGMFVGAGFGTGAEVMLYFGKGGYISIILSSILIGVFAYIFAKSEKYLSKHIVLNSITNAIVFFCSMVNFIAMVSASETITSNEFGVAGIGIIISVLICILAVNELNCIKIFNSIIVPGIIIFMIVLASMTGLEIEICNIDYNFALYSTMNMVLGGHIMRREGKQYNDRQLIIVCIFIASVTFLLLSLCYGISLQAKTFIMTIYEMARRLRLSKIAWLIIIFAIVTTQISSGNVIAESINKLFNKKFSLIFLILLTLDCCTSDFGLIISKLYPLIGIIGIIYTISCFFIVISAKLNHKKSKKLYSN